MFIVDIAVIHSSQSSGLMPTTQVLVTSSITGARPVAPLGAAHLATVVQLASKFARDRLQVHKSCRSRHVCIHCKHTKQCKNRNGVTNWRQIARQTGQEQTDSATQPLTPFHIDGSKLLESLSPATVRRKQAGPPNQRVFRSFTARSASSS